MDSSGTNPVNGLRQRVTCLEAALSVGLADPTRKAVHELRSETRRVEARLDLLDTLRTSVPGAEGVRRCLGRIRRRAGEVRDYDVQRKLLQKLDLTRPGVESVDDMERDRDRLRKVLKRERKKVAKRLERCLQRQQPKLTNEMETVLEALKPREGEVSTEELLQEIVRRFGRALHFRRMDTERLHAVRKAAKHARYQCESLPGAEAAAVAKQLEEFQDAGGSWHDYLVLAERAVKELGADHALTRVLEGSRDKCLNVYLERMEELRHPSSPDVRAKRPPQRETDPQRRSGNQTTARKMTA